MNYGWRFMTLYRRQGSRSSPRKKMQKSKMAVWGGLTNSCEKKRSEKQRRKGKIYTNLNAEFQRIARRDKKAFLSDRCKEIEENNRMGITRDLFKKTRDTKVTFHAKMDSIKDRNDMDPTETEDIKKRWQEHTEGWSWDGWAPGSALQALSSPLRPSSQGGTLGFTDDRCSFWGH